jgi:acyl carrier protein
MERLGAMRKRIREFVGRNLLGAGKSISDSDPLFSKGRIDSLGHLKLISFLEKEFHISLSMDDLKWENFDTIEKIEALVKRKATP